MQDQQEVVSIKSLERKQEESCINLTRTEFERAYNSANQLFKETIRVRKNAATLRRDLIANLVRVREVVIMRHEELSTEEKPLQYFTQTEIDKYCVEDEKQLITAYKTTNQLFKATIRVLQYASALRHDFLKKLASEKAQESVVDGTIV